MKKLLFVFLAIIMVGQNLVYVGIGIYYHVNKAYISKQLCINRNNPQMHCNGRCYLSAQLKKAQTGESKSAQIIKEKEQMIAFYSADSRLSVIYEWHFTGYTGNYAYAHLLPIPPYAPDRPPQVCTTPQYQASFYTV